jgi:peptidoglycan/LPS O-acetylase OafA/YrhL
MPTDAESRASGTLLPRLDVPPTARSLKSQRIPALDFTKGALVLIMVLYHWINYFIGPQWAYYEYLHFLTPSFIFITGFTISNVYLSKYAATDSRLSKRLITRGLKLIAIFLFLNVARSFVLPVLGTGVLVRNPMSVGNVFSVFVSGNLPVMGGKLVAFSILVPISYMLMLSGGLMVPYRFYGYTFHLVSVLLLLSILILGLKGEHSYNLEFLAIGMLGVLTGFIPIVAINDFVRHPYRLAFAYVCYVIAITVWNIPFPLLVVAVFLNLMAIYLLGSSGGESGTIKNEVILLGKYSLFGYISQIAILQILSSAFHRTNFGGAALGISFLAAFALTIACAEVVDRARASAVSLDRLYKAVFA